MDISRQVSPSLLLLVPGGYCQRALVGETEMIRTRGAETQYISNGKSVWDALFNTTP
jgi:hypothetical protein